MVDPAKKRKPFAFYRGFFILGSCSLFSQRITRSTKVGMEAPSRRKAFFPALTCPEDESAPRKQQRKGKERAKESRLLTPLLRRP